MLVWAGDEPVGMGGDFRDEPGITARVDVRHSRLSSPHLVHLRISRFSSWFTVCQSWSHSLMASRFPGRRDPTPQARFTAEMTAFSDAVTMFGSIPTPHRIWSPTAHST